MKNFYFLFFLLLAKFSATASVYTVTDTTANSTSSLAYAIAQANAHLGRDTIEFNIPGTQAHQIILDSLPDISDSVFIDGLSQPGNNPSANYTLCLVGNKSLTVRSANCTLRGLFVSNYSGTLNTGMIITADSGKTVSNTQIFRCRIEGENGINIFPNSIYSLNSSGIIIDSVDISSRGSLEISTTASSDITNVSITNNRFWANYNCGGGAICAGTSLYINRQSNFPSAPNYTIRGNFFSGNIHLVGYLDSIYIGHDTISACQFLIDSASISKSKIEFNQTVGGCCSCGPYELLSIKNFLSDTIRNIHIHDNDFEGGQIRLDFSGSNQVFDSIFFEHNNNSWCDIYLEKNNGTNIDTQSIQNLFIRNNYGLFGSAPTYYSLRFNFKGLSDFSDIHIENNQMLNDAYLFMQSDTLSVLRNVFIAGNKFKSENSPIMNLWLYGKTNHLVIEDDSISFVPGTLFKNGIFCSGGVITNFSVMNNYISLNGGSIGWGVPENNGIQIQFPVIQGEIKHNHILNCSDAAIAVFGTTDSANALEIDSNFISGCVNYYGIGIMSSPYNPPSQNIGRYTMLGNSIYNIGKEGIYRFSQHDTASCMTCIPKPQLITAEYFGGNTSVSGTLTGDTLTDYIIEFFSNTVADTSGYGEGEIFIYRDTVTTDASGVAVFATNITGNYLNAFITSTATSMATYQTSEFSNEAGVVLGVANNDIANNVHVFPNPVSGKVFIYSSAKINSVEVLDVTGKILLTQNGNNNTLVAVDLTSFSGGVYFLNLHCGDNVSVSRVLKN